MIKINLNKSSLINADCLEAMRSMPDNCTDSVVTDAPYGLSFMGKKWDYDVPSSEIFQEILRVLKPGGHMLCACGTRTQHRMAVNIEDAGFEVRDVITWLYGSGFPKSMDISKAIDRQSGAEREVIGTRECKSGGKTFHGGEYKLHEDLPVTAPATDAAKQWQGWGTALKPACEFWTLARKPLSEKTVAANVLEHGTGGINIDASRIGTAEASYFKTNHDVIASSEIIKVPNQIKRGGGHNQGRWPANLILDEAASKVLDEQSGISKSAGGLTKKFNSGNEIYGKFQEKLRANAGGLGDSGGASRFFYVAKASKSERNAGLDHLEKKIVGSFDGNIDHENARKIGANPEKPTEKAQNFHPTVKPIKLMTYLVRLITPPNGICLDPFMGSGSTGVAAVKEGFGFIGIEREPAYFEICKARIESA